MNGPDYDGRGLANLMASLESGLGGVAHEYVPLNALPPARVGRHRQLLLLLIDGLGFNYLRAHPEAACLNRHLADRITSVFPPTTAAAVTTVLTGDAPQQHGLTGWFMYFRELARVMAILPAHARAGGFEMEEAALAQLLGHTPFPDRIARPAYLVSPRFIVDSPFNRSHVGRARALAYDDLEGMAAACAELTRTPGDKYVYAYWPTLDSLGHQFGIWSDQARQHLLALDRAFERLLAALRGTDTLVIVTADHGQVDVPPGRTIDLADHPVLQDCLALPLCGEPRAAYCYLKPAHETAFDGYVRDHLSDRASAIRATEAVDRGWYGRGTPHPELGSRIGDRILLMKKDYAIKDWLPGEERYRMIGMHGGISDEELWVPLIVAET